MGLFFGRSLNRLENGSEKAEKAENRGWIGRKRGAGGGQGRDFRRKGRVGGGGDGVGVGGSGGVSPPFFI